MNKLGQDIYGEANDDNSGWAVALSADGTRVAVGEPSNDVAGKSNCGQVRIYELMTDSSNNKSWSQLGQDINGEDSTNYSGKSVALSADGTRLAVGAHGNFGANGIYSGHVKVYDLITDSSNNKSWNQLGQDIDGEASGDNSGQSVALSADGARLAIGAPSNDGEG